MSATSKANDNECIQVVVRCRPMNKKETEEKRKSIIDIDIEARSVSIRNPDNESEPPKTFTYDASYDDKTQQRVFYDESCFSVIEGTLEGFNSTIFAYGQTGCGKSFTMQGPSTSSEDLKGVIPNSFSHIFDFVKSSKDVQFLIHCQYLELYNEEIKDLLATNKNAGKLDLREDPQKGVYVSGITDIPVESTEDLNKMLDRGLGNRTVAATLMNAESSRSHSIFTIIIEMTTKDSSSGKELLRVGKLNLVDLAGSERQKKTGAKDATLKEGIKINLSLSALGNVISALSEGRKGGHIPYRDSKLTRLLQDSLGGNTKTMMIAAISPADYNFEETMSTLRYANRAKNIKNKPKINEDPKDAMIREFKEEIERLRALLAQQSSQALLTAPLPSSNSSALSASVMSVVPSMQAPSPAEGKAVGLSGAAVKQLAPSPRGAASATLSPRSVASSSLPPLLPDEDTAVSTPPMELIAAVYDVIDFQDTAGDAACEHIVEAPLFNEAKSVSPRSNDVSVPVSSSLRVKDAAVKPISPRGKSVSPRATDGGAVVVGSPRANVSDVRAKAKSPRLNELKSLSPRASDSYTVSPRAIEVTTALVSPRGGGGGVSSNIITVTPRMGGPTVLPSLEPALSLSAVQMESPTPYSPDRDHDSHWPPLSHEEESICPPQKSQSEIDREDTQQRLQQLEYLLVHHTIHGAASNEEKAVHPSQVETADTPEQVAAAKRYQQKRMEARRKKEAAQQREMQRLVEERRSMELELEELRVSQAGAGRTDSAPGAEVEALILKRVGRVKKRYDKKLAALQEELDDLSEDFYYQRRQLVESAMEQEKDSKLYEAICYSILPERDVRKILERSKYDEERDEWILPFAKKKLLREAVTAGAHAATAAASGASMLPDIFNKSQAEGSSRSDPAAFVAKANAPQTGIYSSINSSINRRASSSREASRQNNTSSSNNSNRPQQQQQQTNSKSAIVPLLTLPGTSSAALTNSNSNSRGDTSQGMAATAGATESSRKGYAIKESSRLQSSQGTQQGQGRSTAEQKNRRTSRSKEQDSQEQDAAFSFADDSNAYSSSRASADPEAGSGVAAGPLLEWGFVGAASSHDRGIGYSGPELVYSDDDDFETAEDAMNANSSSRHIAGFNAAAPFPPTHGSSSSSQQGGNKGRKKKKKSSSSNKAAAADQSSSSYEKPSTVTSLPPI